MSTRQRQIFIISIMALLMYAGLAYAQSSPNYRIEADVLSGGGGEGNSAHYELIGTLGQASAIGSSSSSAYVNFAGFWYVMSCGPVQAEIIGTWASGIWYWNPATTGWTKMYGSVPSGPIAAGDVSGDGRADVISVWPSGLWVQDGATLGWNLVDAKPPSQVAVGDISGDGRAEIIGAWGSGIWYWNPATSGWTKMYGYVPSGPIAAGDVSGDGRADVISVWPSGLWVQDGATLGWTKVHSSAPSRLAVGDITGD